MILCKNIEEYSVIYSSIQTARRKNRNTMAENLKQDFETYWPCKIHWDSNLIKDIAGQNISE